MTFLVYQKQHNGSRFKITEVQADSYSILPGKLTRIDFHTSEQTAREFPVLGRIASLSTSGNVVVEAV